MLLIALVACKKEEESPILNLGLAKDFKTIKGTWVLEKQYVESTEVSKTTDFAGAKVTFDNEHTIMINDSISKKISIHPRYLIIEGTSPFQYFKSSENYNYTLRLINNQLVWKYSLNNQGTIYKEEYTFNKL